MAISRNACSLPDFHEFAQAVRYGVPGTPGPKGRPEVQSVGGPLRLSDQTTWTRGDETEGENYLAFTNVKGG
jgi:hypothetical protein